MSGAAAKRVALSRDQRGVLEAVYAMEKLPDSTLREKLSSYLNLSTRQIQVWFQNRRQRAKSGGGPSSAASKKWAQLNTPTQIMDALFDFSPAYGALATPQAVQAPPEVIVNSPSRPLKQSEPHQEEELIDDRMDNLSPATMTPPMSGSPRSVSSFDGIEPGASASDEASDGCDDAPSFAPPHPMLAAHFAEQHFSVDEEADDAATRFSVPMEGLLAPQDAVMSTEQVLSLIDSL